MDDAGRAEVVDEQAASFADMFAVVEWPTMRKLMKFPDAMALFWFYKATTQRQGTASVYCTTSFVMKGMGWGRDKFSKAKGKLKELGIIQDKLLRSPNGTVKKHFIVLLSGLSHTGVLPQGGESYRVDKVTPNTGNLNKIQETKDKYSTQAQEESCETEDKFFAIRDEQGNVKEIHPILPETAPPTSPRSAAPPSTQKRSYNEYDLANSLRLYDLISQNNSTFKRPNMSKWAAEFSLMRRIDKREQRQVMAMMEWSQQDSFWKQNILSPVKLRKHWDKMYMRMSHDYQKKISNTVQDFSFNPDDLLA